MSPVVKYLLSVGLPYLLRVSLYSGAFKLRGISCSIVGRLVIGGAFILVGVFPLPEFLLYLMMGGASMILITRYTDTEFPDLLYISIGVEATSIAATNLLILPLIL